MERKKVGSSRWTKLNFDVFESTTYEAKKMIEGVLYEMRVFAVNGIGASQPSANSKPFMPIGVFSRPPLVSLPRSLSDLLRLSLSLCQRPPASPSVSLWRTSPTPPAPSSGAHRRRLERAASTDTSSSTAKWEVSSWPVCERVWSSSL